MPGWGAILIECVLVALIVLTLYAVFAIALIYMERKVCAFFQCRIGPNRVGKWGLLQVFADVFKMLTKEIIFMQEHRPPDILSCAGSRDFGLDTHLFMHSLEQGCTGARL